MLLLDNGSCGRVCFALLLVLWAAETAMRRVG